jgi:hypothetical protein
MMAGFWELEFQKSTRRKLYLLFSDLAQNTHSIISLPGFKVAGRGA